jgi:hypothetical protein
MPVFPFSTSASRTTNCEETRITEVLVSGEGGEACVLFWAATDTPKIKHRRNMAGILEKHPISVFLDTRV